MQKQNLKFLSAHYIFMYFLGCELSKRKEQAIEEQTRHLSRLASGMLEYIVKLPEVRDYSLLSYCMGLEMDDVILTCIGLQIGHFSLG